MANENDKTETETVNPDKLPSMTEAMGLTAEAGAAMVAEFREMQRIQAEEMAKLRAIVIAQEKELQKVGNRVRQSNVEIISRQCNTCGASVAEGARCPKHKRGRINEIGHGMKHNRMQPIIVRQS
jgi:hypothetical protein